MCTVAAAILSLARAPRRCSSQIIGRRPLRSTSYASLLTADVNASSSTLHQPRLHLLKHCSRRRNMNR